MQEVRKNSRAYEIYKEFREKHPLPIEEILEEKEKRRTKYTILNEPDKIENIINEIDGK